MQSLSILPNIPHTFHHYDDEQGEFSFACTNNSQGILIFADEIFHNGQIRPFFPANFLHNSDAVVSPLPSTRLKKLFVEKQNRNSFPSELKDGKTTSSSTLEVVELLEASTNNERCKKSNSTGFSKQFRFRRDLNPRSISSDSKDVFVFLNPPPAPEPVLWSDDDEANNNNNKKKISFKTVSSSSSSAHEKHYLKNRMRNESIKRRSFLPYRQPLPLVGFFANMNRFSKNIHPF